MAKFTPELVMAEFQRFYYDTAQAAHRAALSALTTVIPVSQIVFGTDFPFRTNEDHVRGLGRVLQSDGLEGDRPRQRAAAHSAAQGRLRRFIA